MQRAKLRTGAKEHADRQQETAAVAQASVEEQATWLRRSYQDCGAAELEADVLQGKLQAAQSSCEQRMQLTIRAVQAPG